MPRLYFITHRKSNVFTGGEFCNTVLLRGAEKAGLEVTYWDGERYGVLKKSIFLMNIIYLVKTLFMERRSFLLINLDFHARYMLALLWARHVRNARIIGLLYHYNYWEKRSFLTRGVHFTIEKWVSKRCDALITISRFSADNFRKLSEKNVPVFIIEPFSRDDTGAQAKKARFNPDCQKLLFVGTVEHRKNVINVIRALALLKTPFIFDIIGVSPSEAYHAAVVHTIKSLGLEKRVSLLGKIGKDELSAKYGSADALVLVSLMEGYGMVFAEAMSFGLPVVATNRGAVPEIVKDSVNGYLCDPEDIGGIARAISALRDRETWERISGNNLRRSESLKTRANFEDCSRETFTKILALQNRH